jgi:hypothetical protein
MNEAVTEETGSSCSPLDNAHILQRIVAFVGTNQYRFVAVINHTFHTAYMQTFPHNSKKTIINASTILHAKICMLESQYQKRTCSVLCTSAARHGSLTPLQYLLSMGYSWNIAAYHMAAKYGHVHILKHLTYTP